MLAPASHLVMNQESTFSRIKFPTVESHAGHKFYTWLGTWNWDLAVMPGENPRASCLQRYNDDVSTNTLAAIKIDACACDAIVTDCHIHAESAGTGVAENSGPFNVHNGVSASGGDMTSALEFTGADQAKSWSKAETHWWNANDNYMTNTVGYAADTAGNDDASSVLCLSTVLSCLSDS